jgi:hypothetical protein
MSKDNSIVIPADVTLTLLGAFSWIKDVKGIGPGTWAILDLIPASLVTGAATASDAVNATLSLGRQLITEMCMGRYTNHLRSHFDSFLKQGASEKWTAREIMRALNKIVGAQHALDGKFWEALMLIILAHFLGKDNIAINAQVPTGSKLRGLTDIEVHVGNGRFLFELTSCLGSNWKKCLPEHCVDGEQQPFFLLTPSFTLNPYWVEEMKEMKCQPVSISSLIDGVVHLDAIIDALKAEIKKIAEQNKTKTV